jgi:hypothetical protein
MLEVKLARVMGMLRPVGGEGVPQGADHQLGDDQAQADRMALADHQGGQALAQLGQEGPTSICSTPTVACRWDLTEATNITRRRRPRGSPRAV